MDVILTKEMIDAGASLNGGWSRKQTDLLGVQWPLKNGWKKAMIGKRISKEHYTAFLELRDKHLKDRPVQNTTPGIPIDLPRPNSGDIRMIRDRARALIDTFSSSDGSGSHTTTCTKDQCQYPYCLCT